MDLGIDDDENKFTSVSCMTCRTVHLSVFLPSNCIWGTTSKNSRWMINVWTISFLFVEKERKVKRQYQSDTLGKLFIVFLFFLKSLHSLSTADKISKIILNSSIWSTECCFLSDLFSLQFYIWRLNRHLYKLCKNLINTKITKGV